MPQSDSLLAKRVLIAVGNYPPGYGGAGLRVHRTYQRLRQRLPLDLQAATVSGRGDMADCTEFEGVPIFQTGADTGFIAQFLDIGRLFLGKGSRRFDIVHALGQSGIATAAASWALLLNIPVVRELTVNQPISLSPRPVATIRRLTFRRSKLVVALNAGLKARLIDAGVAPQRIWERPNPVDTAVFSRPNQDQRRRARQNYGLEGDGPVHLLLGRICARKNQLFALDALAKLPDEHRLLLLGPALRGDQKYVAAVFKKISDLRVEQRVVFQPCHIDDAQQAYHASDCCWIPSTHEGMPNVLLEALVCGLPVVVNRSLDLNDHIAERVNGFASNLTPDEFANSVRATLEELADDDSSKRISKIASERYGALKIDEEFAERLARLLRISTDTVTTTVGEAAGSRGHG